MYSDVDFIWISLCLYVNVKVSVGIWSYAIMTTVSFLELNRPVTL